MAPTRKVAYVHIDSHAIALMRRECFVGVPRYARMDERRKIAGRIMVLRPEASWEERGRNDCMSAKEDEVQPSMAQESVCCTGM